MGRHQRIEAAYIAPLGIQRHHGSLGAVLHDRVIDRFAGAALERLLVQAQKIQITVGAGYGFLAGGQHVWLKPFKFRQIAGGSQQEHTAIPERIALLKQCFGAL